ncbi:reverse transcriptase domain-containing protein [Tanacetum coccineum]|uniref:Reverse transcriptase domain-containing protein n=1 Tax=Tanacetum coccineum TaxID=301880 RepID=A0ABQ4Z192_9ASTR
MADNRTMAQMLQAPIEGYEDAIVVPPINANNFDLTTIINLVQSNTNSWDRQEPHHPLRYFNKVTQHGEARDWLDKEPPRSILTWDDLVSKFINQYFPPSKTTYYRNEIITFYQKPNEAFNEAWERFKGLLRQLKRTSALADSGASINLLPHSIYKKLELEALTPTQDPFSGSTTNSLHPSSSPVKTSDNIEKFTDELAPLDSLPSENNKDVEIKSSSSSTLTSPEASELEDYLEKDSIPPGIDLNPPTTLEVLR